MNEKVPLPLHILYFVLSVIRYTVDVTKRIFQVYVEMYKEIWERTGNARLVKKPFGYVFIHMMSDNFTIINDFGRRVSKIADTVGVAWGTDKGA